LIYISAGLCIIPATIAVRIALPTIRMLLKKKRVANSRNFIVFNPKFNMGPIFSSRSLGKKPDRWKGLKMRAFIRKPV